MKFRKGFRGIWSTFRLSPAQLMKKVIDGELKIIGKDGFKRTLYEVIEEFNV